MQTRVNETVTRSGKIHKKDGWEGQPVVLLTVVGFVSWLNVQGKSTAL